MIVLEVLILQFQKTLLLEIVSVSSGIASTSTPILPKKPLGS